MLDNSYTRVNEDKHLTRLIVIRNNISQNTNLYQQFLIMLP